MPRLKRKTPTTSKFKMDDVFETYINEKLVNGITQVSIDSDRYAYKQFKKDCEFNEQSTIDEITKMTITIWTTTLKQRELRTSSINHYLSHIRSFVYWCQEEHYIEEQFKIHNQKEQQLPPKCLSDEDIEKILTPPLDNTYGEARGWTIVNLILATGFRRQTVVELKIGDIDFKNRMITASHTKNKKALRVPMSSALAPILKKFVSEWRSDAEPEDYVFCNINGQQMTGTLLYVNHQRYCERRGVSDHALHHLRHSFARNCILNDMDPFTLRSVLGHSTIGQSARYVAIFGEDVKPDFNKYSVIDSKTKTRQIKQKK